MIEALVAFSSRSIAFPPGSGVISFTWLSSPHQNLKRGHAASTTYILHANTSLPQLTQARPPFFAVAYGNPTNDLSTVGTQRPSDAAVNKHTTWLWAGSTRPQVGKESQVHLSLLHLRIRHDCVSISMFNVQPPLDITLDLQKGRASPYCKRR